MNRNLEDTEELSDLYDDIISSEETNEELPSFITEGQFDNVEDVDEDEFSANPKIVAPHKSKSKNIEEQESEESEDSDENSQFEEYDTDDNTRFIVDLLKQKGITDPSKILYLDDDGKETERNFFELDYEDQLNILNTNSEQNNYDLEDSEIQLINSLRENNLSVEDLIEYYKHEAVENYKQSLSGEEANIDSLSDEEIYILDLKATYDLSDEEILEALEHESNNEVLFKRKVEKLREEYKEAEERQKTALSEREKNKAQEEFETLYENVNTAALSIEDIGGIDLSDEDKDEIMGIILERDINNKSALDKLMEDPDNMFKMAWFASKGQEAFDILHNYYKDQIESVRKSAYEKGKSESIKKESPKDQNKKAFAIRKKTPTKGNIFGDDNAVSLEDLY